MIHESGSTTSSKRKWAPKSCKKDKVFKDRKKLEQENHKQKRLFQAGRVTFFLLPQWLSGKDSACNAGDTGDASSVPGSGRSPAGGLATHSSICPWDRGAWPARVQRVIKSRIWLKWLIQCSQNSDQEPCVQCWMTNSLNGPVENPSLPSFFSPVLERLILSPVTCLILT